MKSLLRMHAANMNENKDSTHSFQLSEREENPRTRVLEIHQKNILIGTADTLG